MVNIVHALLSTVCITIPEFTFMILLTLKFMGRKEMLDLFNLRDNIKSFAIIIVPPAILLDVLNYIIKLPTSINSIIAYISLYILLVYTLSQPKHTIIDYPHLKIKSLYLFLSLIVAFSVEMIGYVIIFKIVGLPYELIKSNFYLVLICSLSSRIIDIVILTFMFIKKNRKFQINISDYLFRNKFFLRLTISSFVGLSIFETFFMKFLIYNNLLSIFHSLYGQLLVVISVTILIPAGLIMIIYSSINYCVMIINSEKRNNLND